MSCCKITKYVLPSPFLANHGRVFPVYDTFCGCLVPRANIGTKNNNWLPQRRTGPWSIGPCRKMDGPGREYPDTPGPGRHFPDRSEGVIVQKRTIFSCESSSINQFVCLSVCLSVCWMRVSYYTCNSAPTMHTLQQQQQQQQQHIEG